MAKTGKEVSHRPKWPVEDPILTRLFDDIYKRVGQGDIRSRSDIQDLQGELTAAKKRITDTERALMDSDPKTSGGIVLPVPRDLAVYRIGLIGIAMVDRFKLTEYKALLGYEFFASSTSGFDSDKDTRISHGILPFAFFTLDFSDDAYYVRARTFSRSGTSSLTAEASTEDVPTDYSVYKPTIHRGVYYRWGIPYVDIELTWEESESASVAYYETRETIEGTQGEDV